MGSGCRRQAWPRRCGPPPARCCSLRACMGGAVTVVLWRHVPDGRHLHPGWEAPATRGLQCPAAPDKRRLNFLARLQTEESDREGRSRRRSMPAFSAALLAAQMRPGLRIGATICAIGRYWSRNCRLASAAAHFTAQHDDRCEQQGPASAAHSSADGACHPDHSELRRPSTCCSGPP